MNTNKLTLKNDIVFKAFFARKGNEKYLKSFLEAVLKTKINVISITGESSLEQVKVTQKRGRIDIKAVINDEKIVDIEVQLQDNKDTKKRMSYYGARLESEQLEQSDDYTKIKPIIMVIILNYNLFNLPEYHTESIMVSKKHRDYELTDEIKYHYIELPKFRKQRPDLSDELASWVALIDNDKGENIKMAEKKHQIIKDAKKDLDIVLSDSILKEIAEYEESAMHEEASRMRCAREEGLEKGMKEGLKKGIKEGRIEGVNEGIAQGISNEKVETAKRLLKNNYDVSLIELATGLSISEIKKIKEELNRTN